MNRFFCGFSAELQRIRARRKIREICEQTGQHGKIALVNKDTLVKFGFRLNGSIQGQNAVFLWQCPLIVLVCDTIVERASVREEYELQLVRPEWDASTERCVENCLMDRM